MRKDCKVSIITVSYNSEKTIEQTIKSVLTQSYTNLEYIIVDGASKDATMTIVRKYAEQDPRIRFISEPDNGIYDAMNKGIQMASGDVVGLINSDDYYEEDALKKVVESIPNDEKYVVYGMTRLMNGDVEDSVILIGHCSLPRKMMMHPSCFVSRAVYNEYQFDTSYKSAADYDLFMRLFRDQTIRFVPVYSILASFRTGGMSSSFVSNIETNDVRYKYGYISKKQHFIRKVCMRIKKLFLKNS